MATNKQLYCYDETTYTHAYDEVEAMKYIAYKRECSVSELDSLLLKQVDRKPKKKNPTKQLSFF